MSRRYRGGFIRPGYDPLKVPNAPIIGTASATSSTVASVPFTAPSCVGGSTITGYTAVSSPGCKVGTGTSSPITVGCLTSGTAYTFRVYATNSYGPSTYSAASNSVTPPVQGQQAYTTPGTYTWVAPAGVTSVSVVAVGAGGGARCAGGGSGGGLGYKNNYTVIPGNSYSVKVGASCASTYNSTNRDSYFVNGCTVFGGGGGSNTNNNPGVAGGSYVGDGGGAGGSSGANYGGASGGGGAGGYSGTGGNGGSNGACGYAAAANSGGGGGGSGFQIDCCGFMYGGGGGGVGILGKGATGAAGYAGAYTGGGRGGSCGANGGSVYWPYTCQKAAGGNYGGGGYGSGTPGGGGAVRIIWPGTTRYFPSTNTGNL